MGVTWLTLATHGLQEEEWPEKINGELVVVGKDETSDTRDNIDRDDHLAVVANINEFDSLAEYRPISRRLIKS